MAFEFKKTEEMIHIYENTGENASKRFQLVMPKLLLCLIKLVQPSFYGEKQSSFYGEQISISLVVVKQ